MAFTSMTRAPSNFGTLRLATTHSGGTASRGSSDKIQMTKYHLNDLRILNAQTKTKRKIIIDTTLEAQHNLLLQLPQGTNPLLRPEIRSLILQEMTGVEDTIQKESVTTSETH